MEENKIPTAEELFKKKFNDTECFLDYDKRGLKLINDVILEHTKLHVKAALKAAAENADTEHITNNMSVVNKESILSAYPESNIQ
jgi:hypothetical protein